MEDFMMGCLIWVAEVKVLSFVTVSIVTIKVVGS